MCCIHTENNIAIERICLVNNSLLIPVSLTFESAFRQTKAPLCFCSEKQAGQHKPCHIDLLTGLLTQMAFIWKQPIECAHTDVTYEDFTQA